MLMLTNRPEKRNGETLVIFCQFMTVSALENNNWALLPYENHVTAESEVTLAFWFGTHPSTQSRSGIKS